MPTSQAPPSRIRSTASPRSSATCCARVGDTCRSGSPTARRSPLPNAASSACATGCDGTRRPTLVLAAGDESCDMRGARQRSASAGRARSVGERCARRAAVARPARRRRRGRRTWTITGWSAGRPFAVEDPPHGGDVAPRRRRARRPSRSETRPACPRAEHARGARDGRAIGAKMRTVTARTGAAAPAVGAGADARREMAASVRIHAFTCGPAAAVAGLESSSRSGNERISVYVGIGVGGSSRQGRGPDFRRGAGRDSRA